MKYTYSIATALIIAALATPALAWVETPPPKQSTNLCGAAAAAAGTAVNTVCDELYVIEPPRPGGNDPISGRSSGNGPIYIINPTIEGDART
jgi:hypothetical protein